MTDDRFQPNEGSPTLADEALVEVRLELAAMRERQEQDTARLHELQTRVDSLAASVAGHHGRLVLLEHQSAETQRRLAALDTKLDEVLREQREARSDNRKALGYLEHLVRLESDDDELPEAKPTPNMRGG